MTLDLTPFLREFRAEALEHLATLDAQLLALERDPADPAPIRAMFIAAHTIKGGAAMLGLAAVGALAHALEDALARLRDGRRTLDAAGADLLFRALDALRALVDRPAGDDGAAEPSASGPAEELRSWAADAPAPAPLVAAAPAGMPRALLAEDSATVRLLETMLLEEAGCAVDAVASGTEALALARANRYALVVAGLDLDGLSGLDLAAALRDLPVVVTSGDDAPERRRRALDAGARAFVPKGSLAAHALPAAVRDLLAGRAAPGQNGTE
ncbi:MAG TPA: Hpt domain-containing protein [Thermomicrobiales bacterium]|nr:Hpt domain-containing protein [Thermomicrobiales bacterium]